MTDLTNSYGKILNQNLTISAMNMNPSQLAKTFDDAGLKGMESSYFYILNAEGNMLYHPNTEKIGKPSDVAEIAALITAINEGNVPEPGVISYNYEGSLKRASIILQKNIIPLWYCVQTNLRYWLQSLAFRTVPLCSVAHLPSYLHAPVTYPWLI